jgi:YesN/AraC family two-component response regulator
MDNLKNEKENEMQTKRPYNIREKKKKNAAYRNLIRPQLANELYKKIQEIVIGQKMYRQPDFSAKALAKQLNINTRYLSAVINSKFGENYSCLHNKYRIKEAMRLLLDKKLANKNIEEISAMVGFANRQSFYAAFYKYTGETPNGFRRRKLMEKRNSHKVSGDK